MNSKLIKFLSGRRRREIDRFRRDPAQVQQEQFDRLMEAGRGTAFGRDHGFGSIRTMEDFRSRVPLFEYDTLMPYMERARTGEGDVLWRGAVKWFAKSSGTTAGKSKFIPVTVDGLQDSHMRGPRDVAAIVSEIFPGTKAYDGKLLTLGGSHRLDDTAHGAKVGDLSAILIENTPRIALSKRVPGMDTALIPDFEEKVARICRETAGEHVTSFAGVPSWNLVMLNRILEITGKSDILEVWPDMSLFVHGGMSFAPYREQYRRIIPSRQMKYLETYNASEGFFAIQDDPEADDMLLMLDYGIFYEFLPVEHLGNAAKAVPLAGVRTGVNYAMIVTSSNGLWRYMIGDTVEFTSLVPHKIRITGRTKLFINAFGEEVIIDNAERAVREACAATGASVADYTAGPVYMSGNVRGAHEWLMEFNVEPTGMELFTQVLDSALQQANSDYEAKRFRDTTLLPPVVRSVPKGTFYRWMSERGKLGGQHKVPRLYNGRQYIEELTELL